MGKLEVGVRIDIVDAAVTNTGRGFRRGGGGGRNGGGAARRSGGGGGSSGRAADGCNVGDGVGGGSQGGGLR